MDPPEYSFTRKSSEALSNQQIQYYNDEKINNFGELLLPNYEGPTLDCKEFVIYNTSFAGSMEVYVSKDSLDKYKAFQDNLNKDMQLNINEVQREGRGLPLLKVKGSNNIFNSKYLTVYKLTSPEVGKKFDHKVDRIAFCEVTHSRHKLCHKYILKFDPSPGDPSQIFCIDMFRHRSLPIIDFTNRGRKYRWVYRSKLSEINYTYTLYELNDKQPSMTDGLDDDKKIPNKKNPLMKFSMKKFFTPNSKIPKDEFCSPMKLAEIRELKNRYFTYGTQTAVFTTFQKCVATSNSDTESIYSIHNSTLVTICLGLVLKKIKDEQKESEEAVIVTA